MNKLTELFGLSHKFLWLNHMLCLWILVMQWFQADISWSSRIMNFMALVVFIGDWKFQYFSDFLFGILKIYIGFWHFTTAVRRSVVRIFKRFNQSRIFHLHLLRFSEQQLNYKLHHTFSNYSIKLNACKFTFRKNACANRRTQCSNRHFPFAKHVLIKVNWK